MKLFKNDADRQAWIDAYRDGRFRNKYADAWSIWVEYPLIDRRFWKAELGGVWFIIEERLQTGFNPFMEPKYSVGWSTCAGYIIPDGNNANRKPFEDYKASKTMMLNKIKEIEKR